MLNKEVREQLIELWISEEMLVKAEKVLAKYNGINRDIISELYKNADTRRMMKNRKMWNDKDFGLTTEQRYLGEAKCEVTRQKVWTGGNKVRLYFDVLVDGIYPSKSHYIELR